MKKLTTCLTWCFFIFFTLNFSAKSVGQCGLANVPPNVTINANSQCVGVFTANAPTVTGNCNCSPNDPVEYLYNINLGNYVNYVPGQSVSINFPSLGQDTIYWYVDCSSEEFPQPKGTTIVTVVDGTPPIITCPANITANTQPQSCGQNLFMGTPNAFDNCDNFVSVSNNYSPSSIPFFPVGTTIVTWTGVDNYGNTATCTQTIQVFDNILPNISCPTSVTVNTDPGQCNADINLNNATISDNCPGVGQTYSPQGPFPRGTTPVIFTATDASGNTKSCSMTVTVVDNQPPVLTCPPNVTASNDPGFCSGTVNLQQATFSDNCPPLSLSITRNPPGNVFQVGTTTVTFTAVAGYGNTSVTTTCQTIVTINDTEPPVISCPPHVTIPNDMGQCWAVYNFPNATFTENCPGAELTDNGPTGNLFPIGLTPVTFVVFAANGQLDSCTMFVTVNDVEPPEIEVCPAGQSVVNDPGLCSAVVFLGNLYAIDCGFYTVTDDIPTGNVFPVGSTTVTYIVTDDSGNVSTCSAVVDVEDVENPVLTCDPPIVFPTDPGQCSADVFLNDPPATDNCMVDFIINNAPSPFPVGNTTVVFTAFDIWGNSTSCSTIVTVEDLEPPTIDFCPDGVEVDNTPGQCNGLVFFDPLEATDNCTGNLTITQDPPGNVFPAGTTLVTFTVTDPAGNTATCEAEVTVFDVEPPVIDCQDDVTFETAPDECVAYAFFDPPTASDNCDFVPDFIQTPDLPNGDYPIGTTTVTFYVYDINGNEGTCSFTVTVEDNQIPIITCPDTLTVNTDTLSCVATISPFPQATATDNCPPPTVSCQNCPPNNQLPVGVHNIIFTATDGSNNTATCIFTVIVKGANNFSIVCPDSIIVGTDPDSCFATVQIDTPLVVAACGLDTLTNNAPANNQFPIGTTVVTFIATDNNGSTISCTVAVVVSDNQNPNLACPPDVFQNTDPDTCTATVILEAPIFSDNCPIGWQIPGDTTLLNVPIGNSNFTFTATNDTLSVSCTINITITGTTVFSISCPNDTTAQTDTDPDQCFATLTLPDPVVVAGCGLDSVTNNLPATFPIGSTTVTYTAFAPDGSTTSCQTIVTVTDFINAQLICPTDSITQATDQNSCLATVNLAEPTLIDNCPGWTVPGDTVLILNVGNHDFTFTATNDTLSVSCTVNITITGTTQFTISCPNDTTVQTDTDPDQCFATLTLPDPVVVAGCGLDSVTNNLPATFPIGSTTVTYTAFAPDGSTTSCQTIVTVTDGFAATFDCPADIVQPTDTSSCTATVLLAAPILTDNCPGWQVPGDTVLNLPVGQHSFTFTATNSDLMATTSCTVQIEITGTDSLTITCPADFSVFANSDCSANPVLPPATANAGCGLDTILIDAPSPFVLGQNTVTYTAFDIPGGSVSCEITVTVVDTLPPTIVCPDDFTVNATPDSCTANANFQPELNDNCDQNLTFEIDPPGPYPLGQTPVTLTTTDSAGLSATCTFNIFVNENTPPTLVCPTILNYGTDDSVCSATVDFTDSISVSDNCMANVNLVGQTSGTFNLGSQTVTLTATDDAGNSSNCSIIITVSDDEAPKIVCADPISVPTDANGCTAIVQFPQPTATDNCTIPVPISGPTSDTLPIGVHQILFTATDAAGLTATCNLTVTVTGTVQVEIICPPDETVFTANDECFSNLILPNAEVVQDGCGGVVVTNNAPDPFLVGATVVIFIGTDIAGAVDSCLTTVTVLDTFPPEITCPLNQTVPATIGNCEAIAVFNPPTGTDNCPGGTLIPENIQPGDTLFSNFTHTVTYSFTDASLNSAVCTFTITVTENPTNSSSTQTICEGDTATVGGQTFTNSGIFTVILKNTAGCDSTITLNLTVIPTATSLANVSICAGDSIFLGGAFQTTAGVYQDNFTNPTGGCDSLVLTTLFINQKPIVEIVAPLNLCPGATAVLSTLLTFAQYSWSPGGQTTPTILATQPGTYSVVATDANGCSNSDVAVIGDICGSVLADFSANDTICEDFYVEFMDLSSGTPFQPTSWFWTFGNGNFSTEQNPYTFYKDTGTYFVQLVVSDGFVFDTVTKPIYVYHKIEASFLQSIPELCKPKELEFVGDAVSVFPIISWDWSFGDGNFGTGKTAQHIYAVYDTVVGTLVVQDKFGCTDSLNQLVFISNGIVPLPVDKLVILCAGEKFTLNGTVYDENKLSGTEILVGQSFHGCDSVVNVQLSYIPGGQINLGNDTTICQNQSLILDAGNAANYLWSTGATTKTITVTTTGTYSVNISAANGNCAASGEITVGVDIIPNLQAAAGVDQKICTTQKFAQLNGQIPSQGSGAWSAIGTAMVANAVDNQSFVSNLTIGKNQFVWILSNGACLNYDRDTVEILVVDTISETPNAGVDIAFCAVGDVQLNATPPATLGVTGSWSVEPGKNLTFLNANDPKTTVSGLNATDAYLLFWTLTNGTCPAVRDEILISHSSDILNDANAGDNQSLCAGTQTTISGNVVPGATGIWSIKTGGAGAVIADPTDPTTSINNLPKGETVLYWTLSTPTCDGYSFDSISLFQSGGLEAIDDGYTFTDSIPVLAGLNFLANDTIPSLDDVFIDVFQKPLNANLVQKAIDDFEFSFGTNVPKNVAFRYKVCLLECPMVCDTAVVTIQTKALQPELIPPKNVITPNGDGIGDRFIIPNYDLISPIIYMTILNRWGDVVYSTEKNTDPHYDNQWQGTDNNGNPLPEGTYFYIFRGGGQDGRAVGYVTILR